MERREFLKRAAASGILLGVPARFALAGTEPDLVLQLRAAPDQSAIFPRGSTRVLRFTGRVLGGRPDALRETGTYIGPTIELRRGERVRIHFENHLGEASIVHWHGLIVPEQADGHPRFATAPGKTYTYEFTVRNPAGTYLYHPHPHGRTGYQVYGGLAGLIVVRDPEEEASGLPKGPYELPLVIQDRRFGSDHQLAFGNAMMDRMNGVLGDTVLVNGRPDARFDVERRRYRLRVVNASNARIYKLAWSDGQPLTVVATDNGLLDADTGPQTRPYLVLGPTERVEILEDFGLRPAHGEVALVSRSFDSGSRMQMMGDAGGQGTDRGVGMMNGMMRGMMDRMIGGMGRDGPGWDGGAGGMMSMMGSSQGREMPVARFALGGERPQSSTPLTLPRARASLAAPRIELTTHLAFRHMQGLLSGRAFEMTAVASDERVPRNEPLVWTFEHDDGMGMRMPHPMHVHGVRFRILERRRGPDAPTDVSDGFVDEGFKDTVTVFPGERVRVAFAAVEPGMFMYHCHNLEHEDGGMMRNFLVT